LNTLDTQGNSTHCLAFNEVRGHRECHLQLGATPDGTLEVILLGIEQGDGDLADVTRLLVLKLSTGLELELVLTVRFAFVING